MRGFGAPQIIFALESSLDDIARKAGIDEVEFRLKNVAKPGDINPGTGLPILSCGITECLEKGKKLIRWDEKKKEYTGQRLGSKRRGLGVACFSFASGVYPFMLEIAGARIILNQDGAVHIQTGATEIGQGVDTVIAQMAAETIGISFESVHIVTTQDTDVTPYDTGAYASRQTYVVSNAINKAAIELKQKILAYASLIKEIPKEHLDIVGGNIVDGQDFDKPIISVTDLSLDAFYNFERGGQISADVSCKTKSNSCSYGCTFVDVTVDIPLCKVKINEIYNIHDSGIIINPLAASGQVEGGVAMGIGAALSEEFVIDKDSGYVYNNNLLDYKVPTITDIPEISGHFVETFEPTSVFGNKSLGEPPIISPPPAIRNAILNATGVAINQLPMTPQVLFQNFKKNGLI